MLAFPLYHIIDRFLQLFLLHLSLHLSQRVRRLLVNLIESICLFNHQVLQELLERREDLSIGRLRLLVNEAKATQHRIGCPSILGFYLV